MKAWTERKEDRITLEVNQNQAVAIIYGLMALQEIRGKNKKEAAELQEMIKIIEKEVDWDD